jgi:alcohol dehydrogenase
MAQALVFGPGTFSQLGEVARKLGFRHPLLVSDRGILAAGYVQQARRNLTQAGLAVDDFHEFSQNPTSDMIESGRAFVATLGIDGIIGLGGGSSMDCAKGINFVLTNGGTMSEYRGYGKATRPMLPMIAVPTTAGTGSESQSYALITDSRTHEKMACGDPKATFAAAILDPEITVSQPAHVTAAAGYDAISHAVETWVTTRRTPMSELFSREAWRLLSSNYERVLAHPSDLDARGAMLLGAHFAGAAIERSMLGATHACANALTQRYETVHGVAIALLLRHVVRWNSGNGGGADNPGARYHPGGLAAAGASLADLEALAANAALQWTGTFNPRAFDARGALEIYEMAW